MTNRNFADRMIEAIEAKGNPAMVGLDPRMQDFPEFIFASHSGESQEDMVENALVDFNTLIIDTLKDLIPTVKLQSAFYEQYGIAGMKALKRSIQIAKDAGLLTVVDAKRNDIGPTAEAYANAFIGESMVQGVSSPVFDADCMTVTPFLGRDSLVPFVEACVKYGKGIFILVKTSNPNSGDIQDQILESTGTPQYEAIATMVDELGKSVLGEKGYSSVGTVVGATYPEQAATLRVLMPQALFLVPGYGAQGGTAKDTLSCFNKDKKGAIIHSSRAILFSQDVKKMSREDYAALIRTNTERMVADLHWALETR